MVHGKRDPVVPYNMSERLERAVRSKFTRLDMPSAGHHDLFVTGGQRLWDQVREFLDGLPGSDQNGEKTSNQAGRKSAPRR